MSDSPGMGEYEDSLVLVLRVQPLTLLEERHHTPEGEDDRHQNQGDNEADGHIADDETHNGTASRSRCPVDVATLKTQEFKRPLKPLENLVIEMSGVVHHSPPMPKNRGRAWAAAIRKMQAPTSIMMLFFRICFRIVKC